MHLAEYSKILFFSFHFCIIPIEFDILVLLWAEPVPLVTDMFQNLIVTSMYRLMLYYDTLYTLLLCSMYTSTM